MNYLSNDSHERITVLMRTMNFTSSAPQAHSTMLASVPIILLLGIQTGLISKRKVGSKQDMAEYKTITERTLVMVKAIDKKLKDRRLMRSLEKFVGGRPYRGDLRLLQRTMYEFLSL
ncbi:hypothetical protein Tco_0223182 [Tanacetum coccineum]